MIRGSCLCGAVRFEIAPPTKWCAHCHCTLCRRAHGAAFVTWVGVATTSFASTGDVTWYASTPEARRGFCGACGSTMFFTSTKWPDEVHVVVANLLDPLDRKPGGHVWWSDRAPWFDHDDDLPKKGGATGLESLTPPATDGT
jgi:hypothetical protein